MRRLGQRGQRGQTIAVFLLFLSLIVAVTFALAGRNIARLQMQTREIDGTVALALAKSGLATTIARFKLDKELLFFPMVPFIKRFLISPPFSAYLFRFFSIIVPQHFSAL